MGARGRGHPGRSRDLLLRRRGGRRVEDGGRGAHLEADLRPRRRGLGRSAGDGAVESEGDLRRHRPDPGAVRHRVRRRHVSLRRRRLELAKDRPSGLAGDRPHSRRSQESGRRSRRGARPHLRPEPRARALPDRGRREDAGARSSSSTRSTGAADLAADPENPAIVYASLWQARNYPWLSYFKPMVGPGSGVYKSSDGGRTWGACRGRLAGDGPVGRIGLAASAGGRVWALVDAASAPGAPSAPPDSGARTTVERAGLASMRRRDSGRAT